MEAGNDVVSPEQVDVSATQRPLPQIPSPEQAPADEQHIVRALYDFAPVSEDDLPFAKGDLMRVDPCTQFQDWWVATHLTTGAVGYIPSNYVCKNDDSLEAQDWWLDVDAKEGRTESEIVLMLPGNRVGTFLVRRCSDKSIYAVLSVRYDHPQTGNPAVAHYKLRKLDDGGVFFSPKRQFRNIFELIRHHSQRADGLCTTLTVPCPRIQPVEGFKKLEIERAAITMAAKLGEGCFGEVWKAKLQKRVDVAVKTLKPGKMNPKDFLAEARTMHELRHRKLVRLLAVCSSDEPIYIVTEFMANGALLDFLRKDAGKMVKFTVMVKMAAQIADGMAYLEAKNYIHRDLRAANILVGQHYDVKVADFGLARILDEGIYDADRDTKFPIKWTAPEALDKQQFSVKSDVWSFGVLLYELITRGATPYPGMSNREVLREIPRGYRMPQPSVCPTAFYDMMTQCWLYEPFRRPTFEYLHSFFDDFTVNTQEKYGLADQIA